MLVWTGYPFDESREPEVLNLENPGSSCSSSVGTFPEPVGQSTGAIMADETPLVCGGFAVTFGDYSNRCYIPGNSDPVILMNAGRSGAASVLMDDGNSSESDPYT